MPGTLGVRLCPGEWRPTGERSYGQSTAIRANDRHRWGDSPRGGVRAGDTTSGRADNCSSGAQANDGRTGGGRYGRRNGGASRWHCAGDGEPGGSSGANQRSGPRGSGQRQSAAGGAGCSQGAQTVQGVAVARRAGEGGDAAAGRATPARAAARLAADRRSRHLWWHLANGVHRSG